MNQHIYIICKEENVSDRHALADKLNPAVSPPLNYIERACARRFQIQEMLLQNCTYQEISQKLGTSFEVINQDAMTIYRTHDVKGKGLKARRALAAKLGVPFVTRGDEICAKIAELRERGLTVRQIATEMGISYSAVYWHAGKLKTGSETESPEPAAEAVPSPSER